MVAGETLCGSIVTRGQIMRRRFVPYITTLPANRGTLLLAHFLMGSGKALLYTLKKKKKIKGGGGNKGKKKVNKYTYFY